MGARRDRVTLVFIDAEYTGEHAHTTLVSLGLVTVDGHELYLTLDDYDESQVTDWLRANVLSMIDPASRVGSAEAYERLSRWLGDRAAAGRIHLVSAGLGSDLLLLFELYRFGSPGWERFHALHHLPPHLNHTHHFDLNTLLFAAGFDPDTDRERLAGGEEPGRRHDALYDAHLARRCFLRILDEPALASFRRRVSA